MSKEDITRGNTYNIPVEQITITGLNKRVDYGNVDELAESIKLEGILQPITIFKKPGDPMYYVFNGHRRLKAAKLAKEKLGWTGKVRCEKLGYVPTDAQILIGMITYNSGKPFNLLEEAVVYKALRDIGMNDSEISRQVSKSSMHVGQAINLLDQDGSLLDKIRSNKISGTLAIEMLKQYDGKELSGMIDSVLKTGKDRVTKKHLEKKEKKASVLKITLSVTDHTSLIELKKRYEELVSVYKEKGAGEMVKKLKEYESIS